MMKKIGKLLALSAMVISTLFTAGIPVSAKEIAEVPVVEEPAIASLSFDMDDLQKHEKTIVLEDGTEMTFGAEPVMKDSRALSGTWRIYGYNPLASMEYYIVLGPKGKYTTIKSTYGLAITGRLSSFDNEKINIERRTETSSSPAQVAGYAKFNYLGNQWVSVWQQSGGVRAKIKNNKITTSLY